MGLGFGGFAGQGLGFEFGSRKGGLEFAAWCVLGSLVEGSGLRASGFGSIRLGFPADSVSSDRALGCLVSLTVPFQAL